MELNIIVSFRNVFFKYFEYSKMAVILFPVVFKIKIFLEEQKLLSFRGGTLLVSTRQTKSINNNRNK